MLYLTRAVIGFADAARAGLRDSYDWHQAVWKAFPGRDGRPRDFLTRLDLRENGFRLIIVSPGEPSRPAWCPPESWQTRPIPESYFSRQRYAFQLRANPTRKVAKMDANGAPTKNGRREPLRSREELVAWILRKGRQGGFQVEEAGLMTNPRGREYFEKKGVSGLHSAVEFRGVLTVTDPARFQEAFRRGIGSAKAFGFGLLVLAPIS